jgi:hypothetical protein
MTIWRLKALVRKNVFPRAMALKRFRYVAPFGSKAAQQGISLTRMKRPYRARARFLLARDCRETLSGAIALMRLGAGAIPPTR